MAKSLILGGAGFLGGNLARALVKQGEYPKVFARPSFSVSTIEDILDSVEVIRGDFMDDVAIRKATKDVDTVFHLISTTFPSMTIESSVYDVMSNLLPTIRLVEICLANQVKKVVYGSSGGTVYGEPQVIPTPEHHSLMPTSAYGQSKLTIENYLNFYARSTELDVNVLRISNPYGPGQNQLRVQGIIAVAMGCAYHNRVLKIYGQGEAIRDYLYVDDVTEALLLAAETVGSSIINVSSGVGHSVMEIVETVEKISGRTIQKEFIPARLGDVKVNILDNTRAFEIYGWRPKVEFQDGLHRTWQWITKKVN